MNQKLDKIEELNMEIRKCERCRLYKTRKNVLCGEGNLDAKLMFVAQAPGKKEDEEGRMFIGPSGKVLDKFLEETDINRKEIYMTNLIKCFLPKYRKPKKDEIKACSVYLDKEIEIIDPKILIPLGHHATKYLFEKYRLKLPSKEYSHVVYGRLFIAGERKIFPVQHPAALLYNPALEGIMMENYHKLKVLLTDCRWYFMCPLKQFYGEGKLDREWIELYCKGDWEGCMRYKMEERGKPHPDNMLPDGSVDESLK